MTGFPSLDGVCNIPWDCLKGAGTENIRWTTTLLHHSLKIPCEILWIWGFVLSAKPSSYRHTHLKQWDVITHPCPNFNDVLIKIKMMDVTILIHVLISIKPYRYKGPWPNGGTHSEWKLYRRRLQCLRLRIAIETMKKWSPLWKPHFEFIFLTKMFVFWLRFHWNVFTSVRLMVC